MHTANVARPGPFNCTVDLTPTSQLWLGYNGGSPFVDTFVVLQVRVAVQNSSKRQGGSLTLEGRLLHSPPFPTSLLLTMAPRVRGSRCLSPAPTSCASLQYTASLTLNQRGETLKNTLTPHKHIPSR